MILEGQVGPRIVGDGSENILRTLRTGELGVSDVHGRYQEATVRGATFFLSTAAAAGTAYTGGAGGTPLLAVHNPVSSGKNIILLQVAIGMRAAATAAGQTALALWSGVSVLPTGTTTAPRNVLSQGTSGSSGVGFVNTALTSSTALNLALPLFTYYWATAAGAILSPGQFDVAGLVAAAPGNQVALGLTVIPTATTVDVAMYWEEVPI